MSNLPEDGSAPARKRLRTINIEDFDLGGDNSYNRHDRTPAVDWTGHTYKAPKDCKVNMDHIGRVSSTRARLGRIIGA